MPRHFAQVALRVGISILLITTFGFAGTIIHVPADQPTIQAGINTASNGDTVLVAPGTYYENINFNGKGITVTSAKGPALTIIDGKQAGAVVSFISGETNQAKISGFTIRNGSFGGVNIFNAAPVISGNVITGNCSDQGGVQADQGAPIIQSNLISDNGLTPGCTDFGGISIIYDSGAQITGNVITGNEGGGIYLLGSGLNHLIQQNTIVGNLGAGINSLNSTMTLVQNLIAQNQGTGVTWSSTPEILINNTIVNDGSSAEINATMDSQVTMQNNMIVGTGTQAAVYCESLSGKPVINNNDVLDENAPAYAGACTDPTGITHNISVDPLFVDYLGGNYHLQAGSPAIDVGDNLATGLPQTDFDGDARIINKIVDLGADEYSPKTALTLSSYELRYGGQIVGTTSSQQTLMLTNNTSSAVALNLIATGANYRQTNNCGKTLAPGTNCELKVAFSPSVGSTVNSALSIFTSATLNPLAVELTGTGLAPQIELPFSFFFYGIVIGTPSTQSGQLTNVGQAPLTFQSIVYSGPPDFAESNNCPIAPKKLAIGASCTVTIVFTPTSVGNEAGTITFNDNALPNPQTVSVSGNSVSAGVPTFNPTSLSFPTTLIGKSSRPQTVTLTNSGTGPLGISSINSIGDFPQTNNCPASLLVSASCAITVTFTPSAEGNDTGYLFVFTDSSNFLVQLPISGTGQAPVPTISSLSVSSTPAGSTPTQIAVTGTGFVPNSTQVLWNGVALPCCFYVNGTTQITATIPASNLVVPGTYQISVFTPTPGGGSSKNLPFVVYQPNNYGVSSATYSYRTISGTNLDLCYSCQAVQITPPFDVQFGGGSYTSLWVAPGGTISFSNFSSEGNSQIPASQVNTLVAPFWADLYPFGSGKDNNAFWEVLGSQPNRELVVEWRDVGICCESTNTVTFQVVFFEGSSNILFNYKNTVFGASYSNNDNGATATSGVQVSSSVGTQFSYYQPVLKSKTSLLWYPSTPTATVSTGNLSFGYHQIGSMSLAQKVTLTNGGEVALTISSITIDNTDFLQTNNCGGSLDPHKSCAIHVVFNPSLPSAETATLSINSNASNSPQTVALSGMGSVTPVLIYPILANFGSVPIGQTANVPVVLANAANNALTIQKITTSPGVYTQTNNCGASLTPGKSCTITVVFAPVRQDNVTGKLSMALNGKPLVEEVKLVGSGK